MYDKNKSDKSGCLAGIYYLHRMKMLLDKAHIKGTAISYQIKANGKKCFLTPYILFNVATEANI